MATAVVSGRVDEEIKRAVDRIIEREGTTTGEVIKQVWVNIYLTGRLPTIEESEAVFREKRRRFKAFMDFLEDLPPAPEWFATMTDQEMNDMIAEGQMRKWGYV